MYRSSGACRTYYTALFPLHRDAIDMKQLSFQPCIIKKRCLGRSGVSAYGKSSTRVPGAFSGSGALALGLPSSRLHHWPVCSTFTLTMTVCITPLLSAVMTTGIVFAGYPVPQPLSMLDAISIAAIMAARPGPRYPLRRRSRQSGSSNAAAISAAPRVDVSRMASFVVAMRMS